MEGDTKIPPALSLGRNTIDEKLTMISPNNNRNIIASQILASPRPRRSKNSRSRRRSLESFELSSLLLRGNNGDDNHNNDGEGAEKLSNSNSNHSFNISDAQRMLASPRSRGRSGRSKNLKYSRRRSFDSIESTDLSNLVPPASKSDENLNSRGSAIEGIMAKSFSNTSNHSFHISDHQGSITTSSRPRSRTRNKIDSSLFVPSLVVQATNRDDSHNNDRIKIEEKLGMTSPNNNLNTIDPQLMTSSQHKSRSGRPRNRRRSLGAIAYTVPLPSPKIDDADNRNDDTNEDANATVENTREQKQLSRPHRGTQSLPSNSGHSGYSIWTEISIHSDTCLPTNQESSSKSSSGEYYSDGGLPYEPIQINGDEDEDDDDDDDDSNDSSNINFNYLRRENGSLKTLDSAFSLNDLGSTSSSISSLSVDGDESDTNGSHGRDSSDKRIQFIISPSRQHQRQQRRLSNPSFGRRRRRFSNADDFEELTEDEEATDGGTPNMNIPNLPNRVFADDLLIKSSYSGSGDELDDHGDDLDEVTVEEIQTASDEEDVEYSEELLNDASDYYDDSSKRYEILISDESFDEEIVVEVEEEEINEEDYYFNDDDHDEETECNGDYHSDDDNDAPNIDENAESCVDNHNHDENNTPIIDLKTGFSAVYHNEPPSIDERSESSANDQSHGDNNDLQKCDEKSEYDSDLKDYDKKDAPPTSDKKLECSSNYQSDGNNKDVLSTADNKLECNSDCQSDDVQNCAPLNVDQKSECIIDSQSDEDKKDAPPNIQEEVELNTHFQSDEHDKEPPPNIDKKSECREDWESHDVNKDAPPNINDNSESSYLRDDENCVPSKSYKDILMGARG